MSNILVDNVSINFRIYHQRASSLKEYFARLFNERKSSHYSDFWAMKDVSFEIRAGERVGIVGHNGAGKSTLLKTLCRIYEPSSGTIRIDGNVAPLLEIGAGFHPEFTGRENIYLNGSILGHKVDYLKSIEAEVVAFAELEEFIDTPVKYYSTGMYTRLAFSLATAIHPDILILDEMFAGGDIAFVQKASKRMKEMIDRANIMVLVSHDTSLLESFCNRVIWMDHGQVKQDGAAATVIANYKAQQSAQA